MLKRFFSDVAIYSFSNLISKGLNLLLLPLYTRLLSPSDYGLFDILAMFGALVGLTLPLEISQGLARYYPEAQNPDDKRSYAVTSLWFTMMVYLLFALICLFAAPALSQLLLGDPKWQEVFRVAVLSISLNGLFYLFQSQLKWELRARDCALLSQLYALTSLAMTMLWVVGFKAGLNGLFYGQLTALLLVCPVGLLMLKSSYRGRFSWKHCQDMLTYSLPLVPSGMAVFVALYVDRIAIRDLLSYHEVGLYGIGMRFGSVVSLLITGLQTSLSPLIFQFHQDPETPRKIELLLRLFVCGTMLCSSGLALFAPEILRVFTTPMYYAAAPIIPLMALATLLGNTYLFAPGLALAKRTRRIALITLLYAVFNTLLNYCLIPWLGFSGAALATCLSGAIMTLFYFRESTPHYPIPYRWKAMALACGLHLLSAAGLLGLHVLAWPPGPATLLKGLLWLSLAAGTVFLLTSPQERRLGWFKARQMS